MAQQLSQLEIKTSAQNWKLKDEESDSALFTSTAMCNIRCTPKVTPSYSPADRVRHTR